jgi:putative transposase
MRWFRELKSGVWFYNNACAKTGRPPISPDAVAIIVRLATDKQMGYRSIQGELKKLGHHVSANTIKRVLRENGFPIGGKKYGLKWSEFIRINMKVTWACDFITTDISTPQGFVRLYNLFFLHHGSRIVFYAGSTHSPDKRWVKQQARNFSMHLQDHPEYPCKYLIHDRDGALKPLKHVLKHEKIKTVLTPPETPQANAFIERFMGEVRPIVDSFILIDQKEIRHICKTIADHHNRHRPHQGIGNVIPGGYDYPTSPAKPEEVRCEEKLGGLLRHYHVEKEAA